ncbi:MAG: peptidoglycan-binding domain-containing protein [Candidatus Paceibacterota bacterium]
MEKFTGYVEDPRTEEEKQLDWAHEEFAQASVGVELKEKPENEWRKYPEFYQNGNYSCVANATAKALGIENFLETGEFVDLSRRPIYGFRKNKPAGGMWYTDAMGLGTNIGSCLEKNLPSDGLSENQMNDVSGMTGDNLKEGLIYRAGGFVQFKTLDIEVIAKFIEQNNGKPVLIGTKFNENEWWGHKTAPAIAEGGSLGHGVCVTNGMLYQGKIALTIEDSSHNKVGDFAVRVITEDWFKKNKITFAGYFLSRKNQTFEQPTSPKYIFNNDLSYGMFSNSEVVKLQECLKYLGLFKANNTGGFYGATKAAVIAFQKQYLIPQTGYVGVMTRSKLNEIFN